MNRLLKRFITLFSLMALVATFSGPALAAAPVQATLYHHPGCQCCAAYAKYLDKHGFDVKIVDTNELESINHKLGVPVKLASCHTMTIGEYVVVGHVPVDIVKRLLREHPGIRGISLPGMPPGSPGMGPDSRMGGPKRAPFVIVTITHPPRVYATR